jgi:mannose-6-phosphate isomerase-like protein (cupin superfamily)
MTELFNELTKIDTSPTLDKTQVVEDIKKAITDSGYTLTELNDDKPWGAYFRFGRGDEERFINEFYAGLDPDRNLMGSNGGLSLKILMVDPGKGLSWQYHNRREEIWSFINEGSYKRSMTDEEGPLQTATPGEIVEFAALERHRLVGCVACYSLVAEIWQHSDPDNLSDEDDIVRLLDDYSRC